MNIITVSREFGSGGRELGKRMADVLGWDYYDREIIDAVAKEEGLDADYVNAVLERHEWWSVPITFHRTFTVTNAPNTDLLVQEKKVIERIAEAGRNCILVGRNADFFLRSYDPFRIFVCAETEAKIRRIDRSRAANRELVAGDRWGERSAYHLTVNTTDWNLKELAPAVAEVAMRYFQRDKASL